MALTPSFLSSSSFLPYLTSASPTSRLSNRRVSFTRVAASVPEQTELAKVEYTPWLIAGLGNPGTKYQGTRHNVGFEMIDFISRAEGIAMNTIQSKSLIGIGSIGEVPILLVKPQSYMNYSGEAISPLAAYYQVPLRHILLVYDEMSLPNGVMRIQPKGGHSHHNGYFVTSFSIPAELVHADADTIHNLSKTDVKSVIEHLDSSRNFPRLCIGIGNPPGMMDMRAFLLQKFSSEERQQIDGALEQGLEAVRTLVLRGFSRGIDRFNLVQKYKYHKV